MMVPSGLSLTTVLRLPGPSSIGLADPRQSSGEQATRGVFLFPALRHTKTHELRVLRLSWPFVLRRNSRTGLTFLAKCKVAKSVQTRAHRSQKEVLRKDR